MLKFHFTDADMARIRMAAGPDPLWELLLSLHLLRGTDGSVVFGAWRRHVRSRLPGTTRLLFDLAPPRGYSADFLTPLPDRGELEPGIDAVLSTPRGRLRHDVARLAAVRPLGSRTLSLAEAGSDAMLCLGAALRGYFDVALRPYWAQVGSSIEADRAVRVRAILDGGTEGMLAALHPSLRWQPGVLTVASPHDRDIHLDGRGLLLLPSFFCWRAPITLRDPELPPVIVYPVTHDLGWSQTDAGQGRDAREALGTLLGRTRADLLAAIADGGGSTSELARRLVVSPASVSQHAAALRDSCLIVTHRRGQSVHHSATALGSALLDGHRRIPQPSRPSPALTRPT
ncbi:winged helix-turn-helix domain-containing protein [Streptomyces sp. Qhu-G9]|uniref:ArsR/SmtB family transcription factor n=1 Tax=Streptomyces sp. Qhu-G9 TaxID=3452799 RepID=UPI0022AC36DE|nr:winged helix-turn-helix domain-containing protein [Streptomyces aurantiacus]WAU83332.1 winged helix-turn-helix domain-containing protein [Streptomyces aurantiacus]